MLELPFGGQTGVLQRQTGVYRRHTWAAPTALVSFNRNVVTLLLLAAAGTLTPHEAHMEPQLTPRDSALVGTPRQCPCSHVWEADAHTMMRLGQLALISDRYDTGNHRSHNGSTWCYHRNLHTGTHIHNTRYCTCCSITWYRNEQQQSCTAALTDCESSTFHGCRMSAELLVNCRLTRSNDTNAAQMTTNESTNTV